MTEYVLSRFDAEELERERLSLVEQFHDPLTARQLDEIGVGEGWRCLDVGAGGGSVTRMLAERVGESGSVVATDLDPRLLEPLAGDRLEVWQHDVLVDPLPESSFDLVHTRLMLMHVPARLVALQRLAASIRPGGWLAVIDVDFTGMRLSPATPAWDRVWSAFLDTTTAAGWDASYGARLCDNLEALELEDVEAEHVVTRGRGGRLQQRLMSLTFERLRSRLREYGATDEDVDEAQRLLVDPGVRIRSPMTVIARRPAARVRPSGLTFLLRHSGRWQTASMLLPSGSCTNAA